MKQQIINYLITLGIPTLIGLAIWAFTKFMPREKTYETKVKPIIWSAGRVVSKFLHLKLGDSNEKKIEEGFFGTLTFWIAKASQDFYAALIDDNENEELKKKMIEKYSILKAADEALE